jgi:hypothetical protein
MRRSALAGRRCSAPCWSPPATRATSRCDRPKSALGLATFALAKLVAKEKVDAWVREPFVEEHPGGREPKGEGLRYAVGELITCTRCVGVWSALGLTALRVTRPREARVVNAVLGASAINDVAQAGFTWLCRKANRPASREPAPSERRFSRAPAG